MARPTRDPLEISRPISAAAIKETAHRQMAQHGTAGLSLRGIARELGVTAPAIYNYFPRLDDLITALIVGAFTDLAQAMEAAEAIVPAGRCRPRATALLLAYRQWAIDHPVDFQLIYGNPIPGYEAPAEVTVPLARRPFLSIFRCFGEALASGELVIPAEYEAVPAAMASHLARWKEESGIDMPDALIGLLMSGWARIHGMVMLELFHHIQPVVGDAGVFYRYEIDALMDRAGMPTDQAAR
jgi:AcrR family transcriptional regulator